MTKEKNQIFSEKKIEEVGLSEFFKTERKSKMISLSDLSKETGISVRNLKKIENGEWSKLPAKIYVQNFLVKCANFFDLDESIFLDLYEKEVKLKTDDNKLEKITKKSFVITPKILTKSFFILFIIIILFYFSFQLTYLLGDPKLIVSEPKHDIITKSKELLVSGQAQRDNKVTVNENEVFIDGDGNFSEIVPLQPGMNFIKIKAVNRLNKESIITRRVIFQD